MIYLNGKSLLKESLSTRRTYLRSSFGEIDQKFIFAKYRDVISIEEVKDFLAESVFNKCEGLMIKTLEVNASYEPA